MSIQFQSQFLLKEYDEQLELYKNALLQAGASEDAATMLATAVKNTPLELSKAIEIVKSTTGLSEDGVAGSTTGGGVGGSLFTSGVGMEYTTQKDEGVNENTFNTAFDYKIDGKDVIYKWVSGDKYIFHTIDGKTIEIGDDNLDRVKLAEDAPMLAHSKADISTYTNDNFTKVDKRTKLKSIEPRDMWGTKPTAMSSAMKEAELQENRGYGQFKREAATRTKAQQMHEAAKIINNKLDEINKLLEYTNQMRSELSEGEEQLEYKHNTKALFEKMNKKVVEAYSKLKR